MERYILTLLFIVCLSLGFLSFFGFYLPSHISKTNTIATDFVEESESMQEVLSQTEIPHQPLVVIEEEETKNQIRQELEEKRWESMGAAPEAVFRPDPIAKKYLEEAPQQTEAPLQTQKQYPLKSYHPVSFYSVTDHHPFNVPKGLETEVRFWKSIFGKYTTTQTILHHPEQLGVVYGVLDFSSLDSDPALSKPERQKIRMDVEEDWKKRLELQGKTPIRGQMGQSDLFREGLVRAFPYLPHMERVFVEEGVPPPITRMVFVESMFQLGAKSKVGATGPWQFMRDTGRRYLKINAYVDERLDPLYATRAAARLLKRNYQELKTWPLAINAYNSGEKRLGKAVRQLHTRDIVTIIKKFKDNAYRFASRNFYPEFLAALDVVDNHASYFGVLPRGAKLDYEEITLPASLSLHTLAQFSGMDVQTLQNLNPALHDFLFQAETPLPIEYRLRVPRSMKRAFLAAIDNLKETGKPALVQSESTGKKL